ncbi:MAG: filamentous hemagglutinin N-terminal domain-containing protein [Verrucomicrobiales bacterium]
MMKRLSPCLRRQKHFQKIVLMALLPSLAILSSPLQANPTGGLVVNGSATIGDGLGGHLSINQLTDKAIIHWEDFSISAGELTQFIQPGSGSAVLNRVVTGNPSAIHGALRANGKVMVINPNGILVGATGSIDVGGLVLSTLDVSDADFLGGGDMVFKGNTSAGVVNYGRVNAVGGCLPHWQERHQHRDHHRHQRHRGTGRGTGSAHFSRAECGRRTGLCAHHLRSQRWHRGREFRHH